MPIDSIKAPARRGHNDQAGKTIMARTRAIFSINWRRRVQQALTLTVLAGALTACGGGGDSGNSGGTAATPAVSSALAPLGAAANVVPITVDFGLQGALNVPNVSVTVCAPGTSTCQTIDHVLLDTGSIGLRLTSASAAQVLSALPIATAPAGGQLAECYQFADGYAWGTVRTADIKIGGETASGAALQIVGDLPQTTVPATNCVNGPAENSPEQIGSNGILGIGPTSADCGTTCLTLASTNYYGCPNGASCTATTLPAAQQVTNPVTLFPLDNNGVIVQLPAVPTTGAATGNGVLAFGIGTQSNNPLVSGATSYKTTSFGALTGNYKGAAKVAFFDTGSNGYFFADSSLPLCTASPAFYCPTSLTSLSATITAIDGKSGTVNFNVGNLSQLAAGGAKYAFNDIGGTFAYDSQLDFGLPFFYGKSFYVGYATAQAEPYVAF
ncbi:MAG: DUF3443 domain-containing protein [Janthinobacterium lividum]